MDRLWVSGKRRDRLYIIAEMLRVARKGALKTKIMYDANLSFAQLNEYLAFLLGMGLLEETTRSEKTIFETTAKGLQYLKRHKEIDDLLKNKTNEGKLADWPA